MIPDGQLTLLNARLQELLHERENIDRQIAGIRQSIRGLLLYAAPGSTTIAELMRKVGVPVKLTQACRDILRFSNRDMTPTEIRQQLVLTGFDFSGYTSNPLSSIHTVLKRLVAEGVAVPVADTTGRIIAYRWAGWEG
jgi:hypothetical protein